MEDQRTHDALEGMHRIASAWRRLAQGRLADFGITLAQYELIGLLRWRGGMAPSAAAALLAWDRPTLTVVARSCLASGWIHRQRIPGDKRSYRLALTGPGEEILDRIEAAKPFTGDDFGDPFDVIGAGERAELFRLIDRVSRRAADLWER